MFCLAIKGHFDLKPQNHLQFWKRFFMLSWVLPPIFLLMEMLLHACHGPYTPFLCLLSFLSLISCPLITFSPSSFSFYCSRSTEVEEYLADFLEWLISFKLKSFYVIVYLILKVIQYRKFWFVLTDVMWALPGSFKLRRVKGNTFTFIMIVFTRCW